MNTSAAKPPRAPPSASDEPPGFLFHPARSPQTKTEQTKAETPTPGILRRQSRLVRRLRRRTNRQVISSARQGRQYKKMSTLMCTHFFDGDLAGNRTRDCAVRGRRLNRLTTRPYLVLAAVLHLSRDYLVIIAYSFLSCNRFCGIFCKNFFQKKRHPPVPQTDEGEPASRRWVRGGTASDFPYQQTLHSRADKRSRFHNVDYAFTGFRTPQVSSTL